MIFILSFAGALFACCAGMVVSAYFDGEGHK